MIRLFFALPLFQYRFVRFVISGGFATLTNLAVVYLCTDVLGVYYLASSAVAFICAFAVSFTLQKFWTFDNRSLEVVHQQLILALMVAGANLLVNTLFMYSFVEYVGLHYLLAQIATSALISLETFFVYQYVIFGTRLEAMK